MSDEATSDPLGPYLKVLEESLTLLAGVLLSPKDMRALDEAPEVLNAPAHCRAAIAAARDSRDGKVLVEAVPPVVDRANVSVELWRFLVGMPRGAERLRERQEQ